MQYAYIIVRYFLLHMYCSVLQCIFKITCKVNFCTVNVKLQMHVPLVLVLEVAAVVVRTPVFLRNMLEATDLQTCEEAMFDHKSAQRLCCRNCQRRLNQGQCGQQSAKLRNFLPSSFCSFYGKKKREIQYESYKFR